MQKQNQNKRPAKASKPKATQQRRQKMSSLNGGNFPSARPQLMPMGPMSIPQSVTYRTKTGAPQVRSSPNGDCRISHREFIQDVTTNTTGTLFGVIGTLSVNPGQQGVFPWLSKIAQNYESYRFRKLRFIFETSFTTATNGTVMGQLDYDSSDSAPTSKVAFMQYRGSVRSAVYVPFVHDSLREDLAKRRMWYVRPGAQPASTDIKEYDMGKFILASSGIASGSTIGELYVEYDLELLTPLFNAVFGTNAIITATTAISGAKPMGTSAQTEVDSGQVLTVFSNTGAGTFTFQLPFTGIVVLEYIGTVISAIAACTGTATLVELGASADVGALKATQAVSVVAAAGQTLVVGALTATTVTSGIMRFTAYNVGTLG